jgi:hypothetical protein
MIFTFSSDENFLRLVVIAFPFKIVEINKISGNVQFRLKHYNSLKISDIDFEKNSISTTSRKTKKSMASRPVSTEIMAELSKYVCSLDVGQEKLFRTKFSHRKWRKICKQAGLVDLKFHDLTKDILFFACSEWSFDRCHAEIAGAFFTKSYKQGIYEC